MKRSRSAASAFDAAKWLDDWLAAYPWQAAADAAPATLVREVANLPRDAQVAVHKDAVARLPRMRLSDEPFRWHRGSAVYEVACRLYRARSKLVYTEQDVCALLVSSRHACGHGRDVKPPFELAIEWARANQVTTTWLAAMRTFIGGLKGLRSAQAQGLKTKGGLVLLLDGERAATRCWSERFRTDLHRLAAPERVAWQRLVLHMGTAMGPRPPKDFDIQASALASFIGVDQVLARLDGWLPRPDDPDGPDGAGPCALETAGSHLVKNIVWLLLALSSDAAAAPACDALVERLARVEFDPTQLGKKIALACAVYFARRPPDVAFEPHQLLLERELGMEKGSYDTDGMRRIIEESLARSR